MDFLDDDDDGSWWVAPEPEPEVKIELKTKKERLDAGLRKTKESFFGRLARTVAGKSTIDESALDEIEEALISSDIGVETTIRIIEKLEERVERDKYINTSELNNFLAEEISFASSGFPTFFPFFL